MTWSPCRPMCLLRKRVLFLVKPFRKRSKHLSNWFLKTLTHLRVPEPIVCAVKSHAIFEMMKIIQVLSLSVSQTRPKFHTGCNRSTWTSTVGNIFFLWHNGTTPSHFARSEYVLCVNTVHTRRSQNAIELVLSCRHRTL